MDTPFSPFRHPILSQAWRRRRRRGEAVRGRQTHLTHSQGYKAFMDPAWTAEKIIAQQGLGRARAQLSVSVISLSIVCLFVVFSLFLVIEHTTPARAFLFCLFAYFPFALPLSRSLALSPRGLALVHGPGAVFQFELPVHFFFKVDTQGGFERLSWHHHLGQSVSLSVTQTVVARSED